MKKLLSLTICLMLLFTMPVFAAADGRINVTGTGVSLYVPEDYYIFSYDTPAEYAGWTELDVDRDTLMQHFQQKNIFLNAIAPDVSREIVITQVSGERQEYLFNFALYDDEVLADSFDDLAEEFSAIGAQTGEMNFYSSGEQKYIYFEFFQEEAGQRINSLMYSTVYNGKTLNLTVHSYIGEIGEYERSLLKSVVDSVEFDEKLEPTGKIYADEAHDFKIDWVEVALSAAGGATIAAVVNLIMSLVKKKKKEAGYKGRHERDS